MLRGWANKHALLKARRLLAYTAMPVACIAGELGFEVGLPPAAYRRAAAMGLAGEASPEQP